MSRADQVASPADSRESRTFAGLTIREHVALTFAAAIVASGRSGSSNVDGVMVEASEYTREWLKEFT